MKGMALLLVLLMISCLSAVDGYKVVGNKLLLQNGTEVLLRGMCRPSMEWDRNGERLSLDDYRLMKQWGANLVRISLNQDFWFEGQTYKNKVAEQVTNIQSLGMGVMVDLHWNGGSQQNMAYRSSITFWTEFANAYKNNPDVMFELYNEPHDVSESVWRNGDSTYAGMQEMYNAVRATGANNVVVIGGLDWAFDLQRVYPSYKITGTNITYATHPYNYAGKMQADWPSKFGFVAADYPVIMTEFGQYCATDNYVLDLLNYADQTGHANPPANKIHWTGWAWYAKDCWFPSLIADWSGTPTVPVGQVVKNKLGNSATPTQAPTIPPTVIPATTPYWAYRESLENGFIDWSWTSDYTIGDTSRAYGGSSKSIRLALQEYEAIYLHKDSNFFTLGSYAAFEFQIYSVVPLNANSDWAVVLYSSAAAFPEVSNFIGQVTIPANTWTKVSIPISSFTGTSTTTFISGFAIQYKKQPLAGNAWLDNIAFVPAASSTSTTKAATTSTTSTTKAPTTSTTTTTTTTTAKGTTSTSTTKAPTTTTTTTASATTSTTKAPTTTTTSTSSAATTGSSGCGTGSVSVSQTAGSSWGSPPITQFSVLITNNCANKNLVSPIVLAVTNWNPNAFWGATFSASSPGSTSGTVTLPSHINLSPGQSFSGFGYQNIGGQADFTVQTANFQ